MADVQPLRALRYDLNVVGSLQSVIAPPYDVIDPEQRAALAARSSHNIVTIDLPQPPLGGDAYEEAARLLDLWKRQGAVTRDTTPALWALQQDYTGPDGRQLTRRGIFARVRGEEYRPDKNPPPTNAHLFGICGAVIAALALLGPNAHRWLTALYSASPQAAR